MFLDIVQFFFASASFFLLFWEIQFRRYVSRGWCHMLFCILLPWIVWVKFLLIKVRYHNLTKLAHPFPPLYYHTMLHFMTCMASCFIIFLLSLTCYHTLLRFFYDFYVFIGCHIWLSSRFLFLLLRQLEYGKKFEFSLKDMKCIFLKIKHNAGCQMNLMELEFNFQETRSGKTQIFCSEITVLWGQKLDKLDAVKQLWHRLARNRFYFSIPSQTWGLVTLR